ncbi:MAG TPA: SDR family oxidoreductase [Isosphaeraceae bacterium]|nr:SDR family oxidoreductase [Isosphaeraceae bacterium]
MQRLAGQVAIVTGGAQGIGGATARRLAEEGASVLIADIDDAAAERNVQTIRAAGGTAAAVHADVGRHADIRAMVDEAVRRWGKLTILVNNAYSPIGENQDGSAVEVSEEGWDRALAVLMKSVFLGVKYAVPAMEAAGGGSIVNVASVHGLLMAPRSLVYEAGKSAVIGMTRQMALDFGPRGIRVNAVCPGHIVTERIQAAMWAENPSGLRFFEQQYALRRCGRPVDIANAIVFLCSDEAAFITGHALVVDGGLSIQLQENLGVHLAHYIQEHPETRLPY